MCYAMDLKQNGFIASSVQGSEW